MRFLILFFLLTINSYAQCECDTAYAVGDSVTYGWGLTNQSDSFVSIIAAQKNWYMLNKSVPGSKVAHMATQAYSIPVDEFTKTIMSGSGNDAFLFQLNSGALAYFKPGLKSVLAWLAIPNSEKVLGIGPEVIYTEQWYPIQTHSYVGKWSNVPGATASFQLPHQTILISTLLLSSGGGTMNVKVDGVDYGNYSQNNGLNYGKNNVGYTGEQGFTPYLIEILGLSSSVHNVVLTNVNGGYVYFEWAAGISGQQRTSPSVWMGNTHYQVLNPSWNPAVNAYNQLIEESVNEVRAWGLNVKLIDINSILLPEDMHPDGSHVNPSGNAKIAGEYLEIIP